MGACRCYIRGIGPFNLAACVIIFSLYNMLSSTVELCMSMKKNCEHAGVVSVTHFNLISSSFTIFAGTLGVLSTITKSHKFVLVVLIVSIITMVCDGAELITNATSDAPSAFQFIMTSLHFIFNTVAMVVFLSFYRVLKIGGTGREPHSSDIFRLAEERQAEEATQIGESSAGPTEETRLMP
ncbi:hypothetical protein ACSSS7_006360 [Eimeria intestinalis]